MTSTQPERDELWRHLDWSFWGTGMADVFREPLAEAMLAGITPEQRQQANDLITRWRDHREFVGRDKYEEQKAEIESLKVQLAERRDQVLTEGAELIQAERDSTPHPSLRDGLRHARALLLAARTAQEG
jgi:hypothetical protein